MARAKRKRVYGSGNVIKRPGRRTWSIRWRHNGQRFVKHGFASEDLAKKALALIVAEIQAGTAGVPGDERMKKTLEELVEIWLKARDATHRSANKDRQRWNLHLRPTIGNLRPDDVDGSTLRRIIDQKLRTLSPTTVRLIMMLLSTIYSDLVEQGDAKRNPVRHLSKKVRRMIKPAHDPKTTPFIERMTDVERIFTHLAEPVCYGYALGAMAGLRTGEIRALTWAHVNLETRRIHVQQQVSERTGDIDRLKDEDSRTVPIQDALYTILLAWKQRSGGKGLVVGAAPVGPRSQRASGERFVNEHTLRDHVRDVLRHLNLPAMTFYQATRHTFASQWVLNGGSLEVLQQLLGHSDFSVTQRYAHLRPDLYRPEDYSRLRGAFQRPKGFRLGATCALCDRPAGKRGFVMGDDGKPAHALCIRGRAPKGKRAGTAAGAIGIHLGSGGLDDATHISISIVK